jgi:gluconokinase
VSGALFIVVMGVSGSGKTTLARGIADRMGWEFLEGDELHPAANVEKMSAGIPLDDEDRWPWLRAIGAWIDERAEAGHSGVLTCSALKRAYRDLLADGRPGVRFCHVQVDAHVIEERIAARRGHYMPPSLLPSQLKTLEPLAPDERGVVVSADSDPEEMVREAMRRLDLDPEGESS